MSNPGELFIVDNSDSEWRVRSYLLELTDFIGNPDQRIEKVTYSDETVWIDKAKTTGFRSVPEEFWKFHIGGYQVCEKWLKDRGPKKAIPVANSPPTTLPTTTNLSSPSPKPSAS